MNNMWRWTIVSILAGIVLGLFMKAVQFMTGVKVYLLLLNIDYMPVLNRFVLGELGEFILHLAVGIIIGNVLQWIVYKWDFTWKQQFLIIICGSLLVAISYYPATTLSERTPAFLSATAFSWWLIGHLLYGISLYVFYKRIAKN